jgi:hypothetical protein
MISLGTSLAVILSGVHQKEKRAYSGFDELVKSRISDGFAKSPRSRLANPEE